MVAEALLEVADLSVAYTTPAGTVDALSGLDLTVPAGGAVALVGESGSGKSTTVKSILGLLGHTATVTSGDLRFDGRSLLGRTESELRTLRAAQIALVPQAAMNGLDPVRPVIGQIVDVVRSHSTASSRDAHDMATAALDRVGIGQHQARWFPHQFSGGMRQRAMIAMATVLQPKLLIADEPTTGLDVVVQDRVMAVLEDLRHELGLAILLVTHDLAVAAELCDHVVVMKDGEGVESGPIRRVVATPKHDYTRKLLSRRTTARAATIGEPALEVTGVSVAYSSGRGLAALRREPDVTAVEDVSLTVHRGEILGLAGESGCGKSSLASAIMGLAPLSRGEVRVGPKLLTHGAKRKEWREARRRVQMVFQDPYESLNPRFTVRRTLTDVLRSQGVRGDVDSEIHAALESVELRPSARYIDRRPHSLSGGERQRVAIARALVLHPDVVVADEPVSMLDRQTADQVAGLLRRLTQDEGLGVLLISHDMSLLGQVADRIAVMYLGRLVEVGSTAEVPVRPRHPYTRALVSAAPTLAAAGTRTRVTLPGELPSNVDRPSGCAFHSRCPVAQTDCSHLDPSLEGDSHRHACLHPLHEPVLPGANLLPVDTHRRHPRCQ
ncbi:dipeptide ABC transporter ATP-binding protein [Euzebya pacifica]|nr:ABC transporter ATP-binding protein [Euzebya pacifica]